MQRQHHDWDGAKFQEVVGQPAVPTPHGALDQNHEDKKIQHLASAIMPTVLFLVSFVFLFVHKACGKAFWDNQYAHVHSLT